MVQKVYFKLPLDLSIVEAAIAVGVGLLTSGIFVTFFAPLGAVFFSDLIGFSYDLCFLLSAIFVTVLCGFGSTITMLISSIEKRAVTIEEVNINDESARP